MRAIVIGATGATGSDLLDLLLHDERFQQVEIFVRRPPQVSHEKLRVHVIDFEKPAQWEHLVQGDVLFSCLGTTLRAAGSKEAQWKVDYDYQYRCAEAASKNGVPHCVLVSAESANPDSRLFYFRMKGQLEEAVKALGFARLTIFKPPILIRKIDRRPMETFGLKVIQFLNKLGLRFQKPLPTERLAQAMIHSAILQEHGIGKFQGNEIWELANRRVE